uniref:Transmembrane protein 188 n=1 Tax=Acrobeloides nanus TaxID=290746 RepID=A0A914C4J9_9BILA
MRSANPPLIKTSSHTYEPVVLNMSEKEAILREAMTERYQRRWSILIVLVVFMIMSVFVFVWLNASKVRPVEAFHKS